MWIETQRRVRVLTPFSASHADCVTVSFAPFAHQLDDLSLAVDVVRETKRRMIDIQRRVDAVKATVGGWRQHQIAEVEAAVAAKQLQQAQQTAATTAIAK